MGETLGGYVGFTWLDMPSLDADVRSGLLCFPASEATPVLWDLVGRVGGARSLQAGEHTCLHGTANVSESPQCIFRMEGRKRVRIDSEGPWTQP